MKFVSIEELRRIVNEAVTNTITEDGGAAPKPLGAGPKPLGSGPKPLGGGPKPLGGGPKPLGGGAAPAGGAPAAGNAQAAPKQDGGRMKDGTFLPKVEYAYYEKWWEDENPAAANPNAGEEDEEVLKIGINYIFDQHIPYLLDKWNNDYSSILTAQGIRNKDKGGPGRHIQIRVKPGQEQAFEKIVPNIAQDIASLSETTGKVNKKLGALQPLKNQCKYSTQLFSGFEQTLIDYINKAPSKTHFNQMEAKIAETWKELLQNMQDPETLRKLQNIGGAVYTTTSPTLNGNADVTGKNGFSSGHQLSMRNRMEVFSQNPNATFVTQEFVWRDLFNRRVIDPNQRIIITKPTSRKPRDPNSFERACVQNGYSGAAEFAAKEKAGNISTQELWAVYAAYNKLNPADTFFQKVIVYDYANTELITDSKGNPLPDVFNDQPGLEDNIKGIPNKAAASADQQLAQSTGQQYVQGTMAALTDDETAEINKIIAAMVSQKTGTGSSNTGNIGDDIVNNSYKYAKFLANGINFSKQEFEEAFCQSFAAAVAATYGFTTPKGAAYLRQVLANRGVDKELSTMINLFFGEYKEFIVEVNRQLSLATKKLKKAGAKISQPVSSVQSVNEEGDDMQPAGEFTPVQPLGPEQLSSVLGVPAELFTDNYEVQDEAPSAQQIQESFFRILDRIELA